MRKYKQAPPTAKVRASKGGSAIRIMRVALVIVAFALLYHPASSTNEPLQPPQLNKQEAQQVQLSTDQALPQQPEPEPQIVASVQEQQPSGGKYDLMRAAGISEKDWSAVDYIVGRESSWRHNVWNTGGSGAYGLCQSLPATKMASAGDDYMTNPVTQLQWCDQYAEKRYGSWSNALAFWQANRWW